MYIYVKGTKIIGRIQGDVFDFKKLKEIQRTERQSFGI